MASNYKFETLDPRPASRVPAAQAANDAVFAQGDVLGIEVTVPALAARCSLGNIDPQHTDGDAELAAIEVAMTMDLPPRGTVLATVRTDLDAIGAMAILEMRRRYRVSNMDAQADQELAMALWEDVEPRVEQVAASDKFARGGWLGRQPLPTADNPWPEGTESASDQSSLAAIAAQVSDFKVPVADRVEAMITWLSSGAEDADYRAQVEQERQAMIAALERGEIAAFLSHDARIAVVTSTHRAATSVGYMLAPVVVARNPAFPVRDADPVVKFTIAQFEPGYVDLAAAFAQLNELEEGWGGSPTIGGSPQGVSSTLPIGQVVKVVESHLTERYAPVIT